MRSASRRLTTHDVVNASHEDNNTNDRSCDGDVAVGGPAIYKQRYAIIKKSAKRSSRSKVEQLHDAQMKQPEREMEGERIEHMSDICPYKRIV